MSKELQLASFRDFFLAAYEEHTPVVSDEDNAASLYLDDDTGWTIHRKRAWMAVLCGAHYDSIDFSIQANLEAGTEESRKKIRHWMKNLSEFIHGFDFIGARPQREWIVSKPEHLVDASLVAEGRDYAAYLADNREGPDSSAGKPIGGKVTRRLARRRIYSSLLFTGCGRVRDFHPGSRWSVGGLGLQSLHAR